jgi:hypothetical protein
MRGMNRLEALVASCVISIVGAMIGSGPAAAASVYVPENEAITLRLRNTPPDKRPRITMSDYFSGSGSYPGVDGHLVADTVAGKTNAAGVDVYLVEDSAYTEWWALLATVNARGYNKYIAGPLDNGLVEYYYKRTTTDVGGNFHFYQVTTGTWILLASYTVNRGQVVPGDRVQTAFNGDGKKTSTLAPSETYDSNAFTGENFSYLYAFTFTNPTADGWNVGDVPESEHLVNGEFK